jgi:outer membrane protein TolC
MKSISVSVVCILLSLSAIAQENQPVGLSLQECVLLAIERNINVERARIDLEKSGHRISETRSAMLPKVNVSASFMDFIEKPKTLLPGIIVGREGNLAVEMGTQYNTTASIGITQVLYNQSALTGLKIAKHLEAMSVLGVEKVCEEMSAEIAKLYFLTLTTAKQKDLVEENIDRVKRLSDIIKVLVDNGMGRETDFERISVSLENLYTQQSNVKAVLDMQLNMIKYMLEIPLEETIVLTDSVEMSLLLQTPELLSDFSGHIDIQMLEAQLEMNRLNESLIKAGYLPTVAFVGQYGLTGYRDEFGNYFRSNSPESDWFTSSYVGVSLSVPIFDGFEKRSKTRQAKLDYQKTAMTLENTLERFSVNYQNALNNYQNHKNNVERQKKNIALAEKVYQETALKYREGLSTMSEVLQDEMALSSAQAAYLSALYQFREAEVSILSLNGEIRGLMNKSTNI